MTMRASLRRYTALAAIAAIAPGCFAFSQPDTDAGTEAFGGLEGEIQMTAASSLLDAREAIEDVRAHIETFTPPTSAPSSVEVLGRDSLPKQRVGQLPPTPRTPDWMPGELMVLVEKGRFTREEIKDRVGAMLASTGRDDVDLELTSCTAHIICLFTARDRFGKLLDKEATAELETVLHAARTEGVRVVSVNGIKYAMRVPNDEFYGVQRWHYEAARLPAAWDITTGNPDIVVAVIDTGLVINHPDIEARYVQGADMISNEATAGDGNGRDLDATDEGDQAFGGGGSSWHGTHVAGTIAAESNNSDGVAGVTWQGRVQPIRVLGIGAAGSAFDILSGLYWAVGDTAVEDVIPNMTPARVVNMSLGGPANPNELESWFAIVDDIINVSAANYGYPILVTAAGNEAQNAEAITPANVPGMITVGASRYDGQRASYSNYGDAVDVLAPGGEESFDQNADGWPDAVLSTRGTEYDFQQGTSMACPHVAGIVALMLAVDPTLKQNDVLTILRQTADPTGACPEGCGAGHVDAASALLRAGGVVAPTPVLAADRTRLFFPEGTNGLDVNVFNIGDGTLTFTAAVLGDDAPLFSLSPSSGTVQQGQIFPVRVNLNRGGLDRGSATLSFTGTGDAAGQLIYVDLIFQDAPTVPTIKVNTVQVAAYEKLETGLYRQVGDAVITRSDLGFSWQILGLSPGDYYVFGIGDDNNDGLFDIQTESFGAWPNAADPRPISIEAKKLYTGVNFGLSGGFTVANGLVGSPCQTDSDCDLPNGVCLGGDFLGGYCTRICSDDGYCGPGGSCEPLECSDGPCDLCLALCSADSQCRGDEGYRCDAYNTCTPIGFSD